MEKIMTNEMIKLKQDIDAMKKKMHGPSHKKASVLCKNISGKFSKEW